MHAEHEPTVCTAVQLYALEDRGKSNNLNGLVSSTVDVHVDVMHQESQDQCSLVTGKPRQ